MAHDVLPRKKGDLGTVPVSPSSDSAREGVASLQSGQGNGVLPSFLSTFQTGRHYKVHKSYIWVAPIMAVVVFVFVVFMNGMQGWIKLLQAVQSGDIAVNPLLVALGVVLGFIVLVGAFIGVYALAWRNMSYVFDEREFSFYSGIITKRRVHVPYARVQSVNHRASIVQRLFGVCTVVIDSAGGASNKGVRVPYLRLETAERMRVELFMRKAAVAVGMEGAVEYVPHADTDSVEGAQAEAARIARERAQMPVAPTRGGTPGGPAFPMGVGMPDRSAAMGEGKTPAHDDLLRESGCIPAQQQAWTCPQCGKPNTGRFCNDCGTQAPSGTQAPGGARVPGWDASQPNVLDTAMGVVGDWRGIYGGAAMFGEEPVTYEYGLSNRELLLTAISHDTPIAVALTIGLTCIVTAAFAILVQDEFARFIAAFVLPLIVSFTLVTWAFGLVAVMLSYGNFRARRRGSRIEVERGLLARESSGIDIERVQSIEVRQSLIRRLIGYCEISLGRIDSASEQNQGNNNSKAGTKGLVIHPFVKIDRVDEILDGLAPELADRPRRAECAPLPRVALRRALLRRCLWYNWALWIAVVIGITWAVVGSFVKAGAIQFASAAAYAQYDRFMVGSLAVVIVVCAVITVCRGAGAVLWARHSGYTWNRRYLLLHNDGLSTADSIVPRQKIQSAATRSNPFQRRLSLVTLQAITAAGTHSTTARLVDVPAESAAAYLDWVKPR